MFKVSIHCQLANSVKDKMTKKKKMKTFQRDHSVLVRPGMRAMMMMSVAMASLRVNVLPLLPVHLSMTNQVIDMENPAPSSA